VVAEIIRPQIYESVAVAGRSSPSSKIPASDVIRVARNCRLEDQQVIALIGR
jgi:hypothetical protein